MKTLAYISKSSTYGSCNFIIVNIEKNIYTNGQTASSVLSPRGANIVASGMLKNELKNIEIDLTSHGVTLVTQDEFYDATYKG